MYNSCSDALNPKCYPCNGPPAMTTTITAHFDGQFIVPDQPVEWPVGQSLRLSIESIDAGPGRFADLCDLAADIPDAPIDGSVQHDHYLYGTPKK
jgi:hypothetical protein